MGYALVLGGRGDIGCAISKRLEVRYPGQVRAVGTQDFDLSDEASIDAFLDKNGRDIDVLIHAAGWNKPQLFEDMPYEVVTKTIRTNLLGFLYLVRQLIPYWKRTGFGRLVIISSLYGFLSRRGRMPYVVSKHGLIGAMKTLAIELAPYGVLVNSVSPGYINTRMTTQNNSAETIVNMCGGIPVGRLGTPDEVASAVEFLADVKNTYINGHDLVVDGGYSIGGYQ